MKVARSTTWVDSKTVFQPHPNPKFKSKSKFTIEGNKDIENGSITWVDPKTVVYSYSDSQTSPLGPQKNKNDLQMKSK